MSLHEHLTRQYLPLGGLCCQTTLKLKACELINDYLHHSLTSTGAFGEENSIETTHPFLGFNDSPGLKQTGSPTLKLQAETHSIIIKYCHTHCGRDVNTPFRLRELSVFSVCLVQVHQLPRATRSSEHNIELLVGGLGLRERE